MATAKTSRKRQRSIIIVPSTPKRHKRPRMKAKTTVKGKKKKRGRPRKTGLKAAKRRCKRRVIGEVISRYKHKKLVFAKSKANKKGIQVDNKKQALAIGFSYAKKKC